MKNAAILMALLLMLDALSCSKERDEGITGRYIGTQNFGFAQAGSAIAIQLSQQGTALKGTVTPPFQTEAVTISNGEVTAQQFHFDAGYGSLTYRYEGILRGTKLTGDFGPLGCVDAGSGQTCPTDSNGTFTATKQ